MPDKFSEMTKKLQEEAAQHEKEGKDVADGKVDEHKEGEVKKDNETPKDVPKAQPASSPNPSKPIVRTAKGIEIPREVFLRIIRLYYKVLKDIVLSDGLLIPESGQIRRMMIGEVMEVDRGPVIDPTVGVYRIQGRVFKDGITGWATVLGNQGVTFLVPGGSIYRVVKESTLAADVKDMDGSIRKLLEGEVLQVLDWGRTSRSAIAVTRIKARCPDDGTVGWSTIVANDGTA